MGNTVYLVFLVRKIINFDNQADIVSDTALLHFFLHIWGSITFLDIFDVNVNLIFTQIIRALS